MAAPVTTCQVCGAVCKTNHLNYGATVCLSCRAFFRRVVLKEPRDDLRCKWAGDCAVTLETRRQCQPCRYKRCRHVGMQPEAVLDGDQRTKRFRRLLRQQKDQNKDKGEIADDATLRFGRNKKTKETESSQREVIAAVAIDIRFPQPSTSTSATTSTLHVTNLPVLARVSHMDMTSGTTDTVSLLSRPDRVSQEDGKLPAPIASFSMDQVIRGHGGPATHEIAGPGTENNGSASLFEANLSLSEATEIRAPYQMLLQRNEALLPFTEDSSNFLNEQVQSFTRVFNSISVGEDFVEDFVMFSLDVPRSAGFLGKLIGASTERLHHLLKDHPAFSNICDAQQTGLFGCNFLSGFTLVALMLETQANCPMDQLQFLMGNLDRSKFAKRYEDVLDVTTLKPISYTNLPVAFTDEETEVFVSIIRRCTPLLKDVETYVLLTLVLMLNPVGPGGDAAIARTRQMYLMLLEKKMGSNPNGSAEDANVVLSSVRTMFCMSQSAMGSEVADGRAKQSCACPYITQ